MTLFKQIKIGFSTYFRAFGFMMKHKLYSYFLWPLLLMIGLGVGTGMLAGSLSDMFELWVLEAMGADAVSLGDMDAEGFLSVIGVDAEMIGGFLGWMVGGLVWLLFRVTFYFIFLYFGGFIVVMLLSPVLAHLSEKTDRIITGREYGASVDQLVRDVMRGIAIALLNMAIQAVVSIGLLFALMIPVLNVAVPFIGFCVTSYFYGFSFMDYSSERKRLKIKQSTSFIWKYKGVAVANGTVFSLSLLIPFCGVSLAGFSAIVSVVAATMAVHEIDGIES